MASPQIRIHRRIVSSDVYKGKPIGAHEYYLEFEIRVPEDGCYAIHVALFDHDSVTTNDPIGSTNDALLACYCMAGGEALRFAVGGAAPAPAHSNMPPAPVGGQENRIHLTGITGTWPDSDGPADNTIEVRARINLYTCHSKPCEGAGSSCGEIKASDLGTPDASWVTYRNDVDIVDGTGWQELLDVLGNLFSFLNGLR